MYWFFIYASKYILSETTIVNSGEVRNRCSYRPLQLRVTDGYELQMPNYFNKNNSNCQQL